ncbi:hypothetical protein SGPA1_10747 [Streptomyces misionensis JCM 4497]
MPARGTPAPGDRSSPAHPHTCSAGPSPGFTCTSQIPRSPAESWVPL